MTVLVREKKWDHNSNMKWQNRREIFLKNNEMENTHPWNDPPWTDSIFSWDRLNKLDCLGRGWTSRMASSSLDLPTDVRAATRGDRNFKIVLLLSKDIYIYIVMYVIINSKKNKNEILKLLFFLIKLPWPYIILWKPTLHHMKAS